MYVVIRYIFSRFGILYQKAGNLSLEEEKELVFLDGLLRQIELELMFVISQSRACRATQTLFHSNAEKVNYTKLKFEGSVDLCGHNLHPLLV
jgi:hypothetical protein